MEVSKCLKIAEFPKISINTKNSKTFYEAQTANRLKKIIQSPPTYSPSNQILLRLWNKNSLTEIYRNIQTFAFNVLQECSSWAYRNGAVQMIFLTPNKNIFPGKLVESQRFLLALPQHISYFQCQVR